MDQNKNLFVNFLFEYSAQSCWVLPRIWSFDVDAKTSTFEFISLEYGILPILQASSCFDPPSLLIKEKKVKQRRKNIYIYKGEVPTKHRHFG